MKKPIHLVLLVMLLALVSVVPTLAQTDMKNTLVMARAADATGLDPHTQTAFASFRLLELIYEPLVTVDKDLNLVPALAESWKFSDDAKTLTINLRKGVKFHDGTPLTSADVKATFERILNKDTKAAAAANFGSITSIDTPDDNTAVFNLSTADVPLLTAMSSLNAAIVKADAAKSGDFKSTAIGTGPFKLTSWTPDEKTELAANTDWWGGKIAIDGIEIRIIPDETSIVAALRAKEIDFATLGDPLVASTITDSDGLVVNKVPSISYNVLQLNPSRTPMDKLEVRQAMSCAIDRQAVLDTASLGEGTVTGPLTIPAFALPTDQLFCYKQDLAKAKELMATAGVSDGFSIKVIAASAEPPTALAEAQTIQAQLAAINIKVEIESLELNTYVDRWLKGDFDAAIALNGGRPDPYTMYARYWTSKGNLQVVTNYHDDTLDDLMAKGRAETDPKKRFDIFSDFQKHLTEVSPWIWLYNGFDYSAQQPYVKGFVPNPTDSLYSFAKVSLDGKGS
ncbi:MAG: ABC transporter substrate-binding protein [Anaerolineae bacterium]|nr:ABC transporter substrate-binding protein [Anaerolineae bacterium]